MMDMDKLGNNFLVKREKVLSSHADVGIGTRIVDLFWLYPSNTIWNLPNPLGILMHSFFRKYRVVKLDIKLGNIGKVELKPNIKDLQIAHRIWTELVTRKAAIPIDPEHDVLVEVYDSWHTLFTRVRELIADLPADLVRREASTKEIVRVATATLNDGLRPHLTKWQAHFRNWYEINKKELETKSPQELQRKYPGYNELISDMLVINGQLISYANELKKILEE